MSSGNRQPGLARRVVGLFRPYKAQVAAVGSLIFLTAGLGAVNPVLIKEVFDSALFPPAERLTSCCFGSWPGSWRLSPP